ncbi:hypothetical protein SAMN04488564_106266 [Lentzea waywayandensis]|uniref:Uncharacterized protein n=1 Tax=Lentzea waywayandensis TaxID=84724 RepID=A0A1I6EY59_9PSEU|nr:hypothetical protein [Lentzea waywayandensis]SFR22610.1 hypothetical protein SAMN04488564_106266 [Lentzea waywayandensis]
MTQQPPGELDGARVLQFALIGPAQPATGNTFHFGDFPDVVRGLALACYEGGKSVYLFYCDAEWNVLTDTCHSTSQDAIDQARFEFGGLEFQDL